ncbi:MAG: DUF515 domain-containing protein [Methanobrevibacter sp.]|uniref:DUF515 domain-containing protein n=1 Tax=Methanobrevibacter sp. TaxID=66852 RepID=UPI0026DFB0D6|nr:DUF515 domain-containing protein [Methanobrevibacter sp.]MDO5848173.1 DUF515 domain-containing protein [Methanobrevibacter sp.]
MNNKIPEDSIYPYEYEENTESLKRKIQKQKELNRPRLKEEHEENITNDLKIFEKINERLSKIFKSSSSDIGEDEKKKKIGIAITTLIVIVLITSCYYFLIYEPSQKSLEEARTEKLNELHSLYKGPLASSTESFTLEKQIKKAKSAHEVNAINIMGPATKDWREFQKKAINENHDKFNRTMAIYQTEDNKTVIMPISDAFTIVNNNGANILSNIEFKKPNTISVPILLSRLQAGAGLISVGSIVDIYTQNNLNNSQNLENDSSLAISGCTVVSIMRCEASGEIESEYGTSQTLVKGNNTNPNENTKTFTANVIEMIKGSLAGGYNERQTLNLLKNYGVKLANCERGINLAELDAQYLLLLEVPHDKVNYVLDNMDNIILTIPTSNAPTWMVNELKDTYEK